MYFRISFKFSPTSSFLLLTTLCRSRLLLQMTSEVPKTWTKQCSPLLMKHASLILDYLLMYHSCHIFIKRYLRYQMLTLFLFLHSLFFSNFSQVVILRHARTDDWYINKDFGIWYTVNSCLPINRSNSPVVEKPVTHESVHGSNTTSGYYFIFNYQYSVELEFFLKNDHLVLLSTSYMWISLPVNFKTTATRPLIY